MKRLTLGFSPCPNDTFIFDALVNGRIDTGDLAFDVVLADVEELNQKAERGELDVTKLSYYAWCKQPEQYELLEAGSALGRNCGPLLIAKTSLTDADIERGPIAIPGEMTTANFLFGMAYPDCQNRVPTLFSDIEQRVINEDAVAGVIIHENRFTYQDKGLVKIVDLGEYWEMKTGLPIPLGGIGVRSDLDTATKEQVGQLMQKSVAYAFDHPGESSTYVLTHSQEMEPSVIQSHIDLYVNDFTKALGKDGHKAIDFMKKQVVNQDQ
jgi:1,4-dihydroxy-6-naphthoate synthase